MNRKRFLYHTSLENHVEEIQRAVDALPEDFFPTSEAYYRLAVIDYDLESQLLTFAAGFTAGTPITFSNDTETLGLYGARDISCKAEEDSLHVFFTCQDHRFCLSSRGVVARADCYKQLS
jgi:hypothetical protein